MAEFEFCAFADEIDSDFRNQLDALKKLDIHYIELRGVNGRSFTQLTDDEILDVRDSLALSGIKVWSLGSPIGKIHTDGDFEAHKKLLRRIMDIGEMLNVKRIRVFSFYPAEGMSDEDFESKSFSMLGELIQMAEKRGFILCHENEKGIYGQSPERVRRLCEHFGGKLKCVLDNGNFPFCGESAENAYALLSDYIEYLHIKDAEMNGAIVLPGEGDAHIEETLAAVNRDRQGKVVITMEPHLMVFEGLSSLSNLDDIKHKDNFSSPFEAFSAATSTVRKMISKL